MTWLKILTVIALISTSIIFVPDSNSIQFQNQDNSAPISTQIGPEKYPIINAINLDAVSTHKQYVDAKAEELINARDLSGYNNISSQNVLDQTAFLIFANIYSSSGDGSQGTPYIFENLNINATSVNMIFNNVVSYFIFKNSVVFSGALEILNSNVLNITNNLIYSPVQALKTDYINYVNITNNVFIANSSVTTVWLHAASNIKFRNNTIIQQQEEKLTLDVNSISGSLSNSVSLEGNLILTLGKALSGQYGTFANINDNFINASSISNAFYVYTPFDTNFTNNVVAFQGSEKRVAINYLTGNYALGYHLLIANNTFSKFKTSLGAYGHKNITIEGNTVDDTSTGFLLTNVNSASISNNSISNSDLGMHLSSSNTNNISYNILNNLKIGMKLVSSSSNTINYTFVNTLEYFVYEELSSSNVIINTVENNLLNLGIMISTDQEFDDYATSNSFSGDGSSGNPYIIDGIQTGGIGFSFTTNYSIMIRNLVFDGLSIAGFIPLQLIGANDWQLENIVIRNSYNGITIKNSNNTSLASVTLDNIVMNAIYIDNSQNISLTDLVISDIAQNGIQIRNSDYISINQAAMFDISSSGIDLQSSNNFVEINNSEIIGSFIGISASYSDNLTFTNNFIDFNVRSLDVDTVYDAVFENNTFSHANQDSYIADLYNANFTDNIFRDNLDYAIYLEIGDILFYNNFFINNSYGLTRTYPHINNDDVVTLVKNGIGNYWSSLGAGAAFYIADSGDNDTAPLRPNPMGNIVDNFEMEYGSDSLVMNVHSSFPTKMNYSDVFYQGNNIGKITWNVDVIASHNIDISVFTDLGVYNIDVMTYDIWGVHSMNETITLEIVDNQNPLISSPDDYGYDVGETGNSISWLISDFNLANYSLYIDDTLNTTADANPVSLSAVIQSTTVNITVDGLSIGLHNYTLVAMDVVGNIVRDTVIITVNEILTSGTQIPTSAPHTPPQTVLIIPPEEDGWPWWLILLLSLIGVVIPASIWYLSKEQRQEELKANLKRLKLSIKKRLNKD